MVYGKGKYQYELVDGWAKLPEGYSFIDVGGVCIDAQDRVYILNRSSHPIMVFDRDGNLLAGWGEGHFGRAHGSCIGPDDTIYCTDDIKHTISKFSLEGKLLTTMGVEGQSSDTGYRAARDFFDGLASISRGAPPFNRPTGVALSTSGDIFVSDGYGNARVHKFSPDGKLLLSWGEPGPATGQFRLPHSIWVDKNDRVWVADRENSRLQIFNANGEFIAQWTDLIRPTDVFIDDDDIVYVTELCLRISMFSYDGTLLTRWGNEQHPIDAPLFVAPHTVAVDSRGDTYIGEVSMAHSKIDRGPRTIQKFARRR